MPISKSFAATSCSRRRPVEEGDLNRDGLVEFADFRIWKNNAPAGLGSVADIPEPGTLILVECATPFVHRSFIATPPRSSRRAVETDIHLTLTII